MTVRWKHLCINLLLWSAGELVLGWIGIDDLMDYSEYLGQSKSVQITCMGSVGTLQTVLVSKGGRRYLVGAGRRYHDDPPDPLDPDSPDHRHATGLR